MRIHTLPDPGLVPGFQCKPVTTVTATDGKTLYEQVYCARGEMENRIKECQVPYRMMLDFAAARSPAS